MTNGGPDISALFGCACYQVRRLSRQITQVYDQHLSACGLTVTQFGLLTAINANAPVAMSALADAVGMDRSTLSRLLGPLQREHLVRFEPGADRRVRAVSLTDAGRKRFAAAIPFWKNAYRDLRDRIGRDRLEALNASLGDVNALLSPTAADPRP